MSLSTIYTYSQYSTTYLSIILFNLDQLPPPAIATQSCIVPGRIQPEHSYDSKL